MSKSVEVATTAEVIFYGKGRKDGIDAVIKYIEDNDLDIENWQLDEIRALKPEPK